VATCEEATTRADHVSRVAPELRAPVSARQQIEIALARAVERVTDVTAECILMLDQPCLADGADDDAAAVRPSTRGRPGYGDPRAALPFSSA
jgi:hypothetical protein